jgi:hypothetical protein
MQIAAKNSANTIAKLTCVQKTLVIHLSILRDLGVKKPQWSVMSRRPDRLPPASCRGGPTACLHENDGRACA